MLTCQHTWEPGLSFLIHHLFTHAHYTIYCLKVQTTLGYRCLIPSGALLLSFLLMQWIFLCLAGFLISNIATTTKCTTCKFKPVAWISHGTSFMHGCLAPSKYGNKHYCMWTKMWRRKHYVSDVCKPWNCLFTVAYVVEVATVLLCKWPIDARF